jgi:general secretion pathway protein A
MYLEYYGLKEFPFNITPDPRFLFYSSQHREAFDHLLYGIENRKGFIELTGEVGLGKTTLCRAVLSNLPKKVHTAMVLNPTVSGTQLLRAILHDFGLHVVGRDRLSYIEQLNAFLFAQIKDGNNVAVIIDEAQDLTSEVMEQVRLLSNLETDQHKLMQIVLAGQPELHKRLDSKELRQFKQRIMVRCQLLPLTEDQTNLYIEHRLKVAGAKSRIGFDREAIELVYGYAKGIPRVINALCDRVMIAGYVAGKHLIGAPEVRKALSEVEALE